MLFCRNWGRLCAFGKCLESAVENRWSRLSLLLTVFLSLKAAVTREWAEILLRPVLAEGLIKAKTMGGDSENCFHGAALMRPIERNGIRRRLKQVLTANFVGKRL